MKAPGPGTDVESLLRPPHVSLGLTELRVFCKTGEGRDAISMEQNKVIHGDSDMEGSQARCHNIKQKL